MQNVSKINCGSSSRYKKVERTFTSTHNKATADLQADFKTDMEATRIVAIMNAFMNMRTKSSTGGEGLKSLGIVWHVATSIPRMERTSKRGR